MKRYTIPTKFQILSGDVLILVACITLLIDNIGIGVIYQTLYLQDKWFYYGLNRDNLYVVYYAFYIIGKIPFPICAFLLVERFFHTEDRMKYAIQLLIFGVISELPYNLCLYNKLLHIEHNNMLFTLFWGFLAIWSWEKFKGRWYFQLPLCASILVAARQLNVDYRWRGVLLIMIFYLLHAWRVPQVLVGLASMYWQLPGVILGFVPMLFYNGKPVRRLQYFFFVFYPIHLLILYLICRICLKGP